MKRSVAAVLVVLRKELRDALRDRREVGDGHHAETRAEGESLRDARREPDAREPARPPAEGERVELRQRETGLGQDGVDHRQYLFGVAALELDVALDQAIADAERHRTRLGRGVEREDLHAGSFK